MVLILVDHPFVHSAGMADLDVSRLLAGLQRGAVPGRRPKFPIKIGEMVAPQGTILKN